MKKIFLLISISYSFFSLSQNNSQKTPLLGKYGGGVTDVDGNKYNTVILGAQEWMGENLKVTKFNDGTIISNVLDPVLWFNDSLKPMLSFYINKKGETEKNDVLYNWNSISYLINGNKNICPVNWHVPSYDEWTILIDYLGGDSLAGVKLKTNNSNSWSEGVSQRLNTSLFSSIPLGFRFYDGVFMHDGKYAHFWINSEFERKNSFAYVVALLDEIDGVQRFGLKKNTGASIRCLKD